MSVDTLTLARELRAAEIEPGQAEAIAAAIGRAVVETAATKADLLELRSATKSDIVQLGAELRSESSRLGTDLRSEIAKLDTKIESSINKLLVWFIGTQIALGGIIVAIIKLVPAQGL